MLLTPRVQTVGTLSEFTSGTYKIKKIERNVNKKLLKYGMKVAVTIVAGSILLDVTAPLSFVHAADPTTIEEIQDKIIKAFEPLIKVIMTLSYPIAGVMLSWGSLQFMLNQKEQAIATIQNTALGYLIVQMSPLLLKLLASIGGAIA